MSPRAVHATPMGRLFLCYGGSSVELTAGETTVGRDTGCQIRLHAPWVSRRHVRFLLRGGALYAIDLGSRNGTRVDGAPIREEVELSPGDEIEVGHPSVVLSVRDEEALEPDTAVASPFATAEPAGADGAGADPEITGDDRVTQSSEPVADTAPPPRRSRRRHARFAVELPVSYESDVLEVEAVSLNLSASGVFIQTPILDEVGTPCRLTVHTGDRDHLSVSGRVRRVVDHPGAVEPLGLGIEFADLDTTARHWLERTIASRGALADHAPRS